MNPIKSSHTQSIPFRKATTRGGTEAYVLDVNQNGYQDEFRRDYYLGVPLLGTKRRYFEPQLSLEQAHALQLRPGFKDQSELQDFKLQVTSESARGNERTRSHQLSKLADRFSPYEDSQWGIQTDTDGSIWLVYRSV